MRGAHLAWRLSCPKENSKQKETRAHTQLHMLREPGLLRSVFVTVLVLAHVYAAPANSALFLPAVSLFAFVFGGAAHLAWRLSRPELEAKRDTRAHTVTHAARTWLAPFGVGHGT